MRKYAAICAGIVLATLMLGAVDRATGEQHEDACLTYRVAMRTAREALGHGERDAALAALQKAKAALVECHREEARMTDLLAGCEANTRDA